MMIHGMGKGMRLVTVIGKRIALPYFRFQSQKEMGLDLKTVKAQDLQIVSDVSLGLQLTNKAGQDLNITSELKEQ